MNALHQAIDLRADYEALQIKLSFEGVGRVIPLPFDLDDVLTEAYVMGYQVGEDDFPILFRNTPLAGAWQSGSEDRQHLDASMPVYGTEEEFNALSTEEQGEVWDSFHDLCQIGIADDMYFYSVLMNRHLVGYVGH